MIGWWMLLQAAVVPTPAPTPPAPPAAQHPATGVDLHPGDSMIVRPAADGTVAVIDGHPGARRPGPGEARIDLRFTEGKTVLSVLNADPRFLLYRAFIVRDGARPAPTSICPVLPDGKFGFESWPYAIGRVVLYNFRYEDHPSMVCR